MNAPFTRMNVPLTRMNVPFYYYKLMFPLCYVYPLRSVGGGAQACCGGRGSGGVLFFLVFSFVYIYRERGLSMLGSVGGGVETEVKTVVDVSCLV